MANNYPGVTAACPYTICLAVGRPAVTLNVTAVANAATGHVKSHPTGLDLSGAGTASGAFTGTVILTADPSGIHARAVFSGKCVKTGQYGKKAECTVPLVPDPDVTVTYECHAGFTC